MGEGAVRIFEATEIWASAEYGTGELHDREFVESNEAHARIHKLKAENEELKRFIKSWGEEIRSDIEIDDHKQIYLDCIEFEKCCRMILEEKAR